MTRLLRTVGFLMIGLGALILASYLITPLRMLWPAFLALPVPIQFGLAIAAFGFLLLVATLIWERFEDHESDRALLDE